MLLLLEVSLKNCCATVGLPSDTGFKRFTASADV